MLDRELSGTRIKLIMTTDPYTNLIGGDTGTIKYVDSAGTVAVDWDNGSSMGLVESDLWEVIGDNNE